MERKKSGSSLNHNVGDHTVVHNDERPPSKSFIVYMTHFNIVLYAMCFWIQTGVLPVSKNNDLIFYNLYNTLKVRKFL